MTDLHEAFRSLADDEPSGSRIDPDGAVRASRARSRARRHRWLAGGVAAALVVGVGAVVVGPRLAPGSSPAISDAARDGVVREDVAATVERAARALRDLGYDPTADHVAVTDDQIRWSFTFPDPDAAPDDPTTGGTAELPRLTVVLRPDSRAAGTLFCDGPSCGGLVRTQTEIGYSQVSQTNGVAQQVLERTYEGGATLQLAATSGMQGGLSGGVVEGFPVPLDDLAAVADAVGDPTALFASDLPLPAPDPSDAEIAWGDGRIDCATTDWMASLVHLPEDSGSITAAYTCTTVAREVTGDGTWLVQVVRRIDGDLAALRSVLEPGDAPAGNGPCTLNIDLGPPLWVVTDSGSVVTRVPLDECGHAVSEAVAAVDALPTTAVSREQVRQLESETAVESGCSQDFKDMLRETAGDARMPDSDSALPHLDEGGTWTVCRYDVVSQDGSPVGSLATAKELTPNQTAKVNDALAQSRPDAACRVDDHTRFAILTDGESNYWIDVALDGCAVQHHPVNGGTVRWRASDDLRTLLS